MTIANRHQLIFFPEYPTMVPRDLFALFFSLLLILCVTVPLRAQIDDDGPDIADLSEISIPEPEAPESASPEQVPLTVYIRKYIKGTTRGGSGGSGSSRETEAGALIWTDPIKNLSLWNLNYSMVENQAVSYGMGAALPSGLMDDPDAPTGGYGLSAYATIYFNGTPFYGFFGELSLFYSMLESDNADLEGTIGGISLGYMLGIGGPFILEFSLGADIPLDAPDRKIQFVYNSDDGNVTVAGGIGLGITL